MNTEEAITIENNEVQKEIYGNSEEKASFFSTYINLTNTTIGAGTLSMHLVLRECGVILGLIIMFLAMLLSLYAYRTLIISTNDTKTYNNKELCKVVIANWSSYIFEIFIIVCCIGTCCTYINVLSRSLGPHLRGMWGNVPIFNDYIACLLIVIFILLPLCCLRKIDFLSFTSTAAIISMIFVLIVVGIRLDSKTINSNIPLFRFDNFFGIMFVIPIMLFGYLNQSNMMPIYRELYNKSSTKMTFIASLTMITCFIMYATSGIVGYLSFYELSSVKGNILDNFSQKDILISIAKLFVYLTVTFSYPVIFYTAREGVFNIMNKKEIDDGLWYITTIILMAITYIIGTIVPNISLLMNLSITLSGLFSNLVFPIAIYFIYYKSIWKRISSFIMLMVCLMLGVVGLTGAIMDIVNRLK